MLIYIQYQNPLHGTNVAPLRSDANYKNRDPQLKKMKPTKNNNK